MNDDTTIRPLLRSVGLRATEQRCAVLSHLMNEHRPHTIIELAQHFAKAIDTATIYRTIEGFVQAGIVQEINLGAGKVHYEYRDTEHQHHHIVCTSCGDIEDTPACRDEALEKETLHKSKKFAQIDMHALEFFGTCHDCTTK